MAERNDSPRNDAFDQDLERDNRQKGQHHTMADLAGDRDGGGPDGGDPVELTAGHDLSRTDQGEFPQHARKGQAESPVEENHYEPPKHKEGHGSPKLDR
jgi:hypothetical protein